MPPREANNLEFLGGQRERADLLQGSNPHVSAGWSSLVTRIHLSHQPPPHPASLHHNPPWSPGPRGLATAPVPMGISRRRQGQLLFGWKLNMLPVPCENTKIKSSMWRTRVFGWKHTVSERLLLGGAPSPTAGFSPSISQWSNVQNNVQKVEYSC